MNDATYHMDFREKQAYEKGIRDGCNRLERILLEWHKDRYFDELDKATLRKLTERAKYE